MGGEAAGDTAERWRTSYRRVRKDPLRGSDSTNRRRLAAVGAEALGGGRWLDLGSGDGNLVPSLFEAGADEVVALEHQPELAVETPPPARAIVGSAVGLPFATGRFDVVVVMDVLHHLPPEALEPSLEEIVRVLRVDGHLLVFEPARTPTRRVLTVLLMSPLARLTRFSRDKRAMVEQEASTLDPWLRHGHRLPQLLGRLGAVLDTERRGPLHASYRFRLGAP